VTPDGRRAVSASRDRTIRVWDLATQACLSTFCGSADFRAVAVTNAMICAGDAAGTLWFLEMS
ncbi:MAG TPA: hypothetical protein VLM79_18390, partial [Kofleriaceae bacterium]|nr:hypothetical protein [Kofleriaceae bacterium]